MKTRVFLLTGTLLLTPTPVWAEPDWDALAQCESSNSNANTGNGYHGFYQFDDETWASTGRSGSASDYSKAEQTEAARDLYAARGSRPWPTCGRHLAGSLDQSPRPTARVAATTQRPVPADVAIPTPARSLALTG